MVRIILQYEKKKGRAKIILYVAFCNIIYLTYIFATLFYSYSIKDLLVFINLPQNVNLYIVNYSINRFTWFEESL